MQLLYFDPDVQGAICQGVTKIRGAENQDDARQEAYYAIADEGPINKEDAISCAARAIEKYRKRLSRESARDAEGWVNKQDRAHGGDPEVMDLSIQGTGPDSQNNEDIADMDRFSDNRSYEGAAFPIRRKAFIG